MPVLGLPGTHAGLGAHPGAGRSGTQGLNLWNVLQPLQGAAVSSPGVGMLPGWGSFS